MLSLRYLTLEMINRYDDCIIEIGSESCSIKCCSELERISKEYKRFRNIKFRIVTPKVPQARFSSVLESVLNAYEKLNVCGIIVNDYGILYELSRLNLNVQLIFGRLLVRSEEYEHNYKKRVHPEEKVDMLNCYLYPSILHKKKIELLKKMNVHGVELSPSDSVKDMVENIHDFGLDVYIHYNTLVGAVGRACTYAKNSNISPENCSLLCDTIHHIKLNRMYGTFPEPSESDVNMFANNAVVGNIVYFLMEYENFPYTKCHDTIVDTRFIPLNETYIMKLIEKLGGIIHEDN